MPSGATIRVELEGFVGGRPNGLVLGGLPTGALSLPFELAGDVSVSDTG